MVALRDRVDRRRDAAAWSRVVGIGVSVRPAGRARRTPTAVRAAAPPAAGPARRGRARRTRTRPRRRSTSTTRRRVARTSGDVRRARSRKRRRRHACSRGRSGRSRTSTGRRRPRPPGGRRDRRPRARVGHRRIADVAVDELHVGGKVGRTAAVHLRLEAVEHDDLVARLQETRTRCEPMNPAPPVTSVLMRPHYPRGTDLGQPVSSADDSRPCDYAE